MEIPKTVTGNKDNDLKYRAGINNAKGDDQTGTVNVTGKVMDKNKVNRNGRLYPTTPVKENADDKETGKLEYFTE